jgi:CxxC-x17-CxxC domain-containing protein
LVEREEKRAKNFFHMMRWLRDNPSMLIYAKTGWPRLSRYRMFKSSQQDAKESKYCAICADCGAECQVPFKPDKHRPVYCKVCWSVRKSSR